MATKMMMDYDLAFCGLFLGSLIWTSVTVLREYNMAMSILTAMKFDIAARAVNLPYDRAKEALTDKARLATLLATQLHLVSSHPSYHHPVSSIALLYCHWSILLRPRKSSSGVHAHLSLTFVTIHLIFTVYSRLTSAITACPTHSKTRPQPQLRLRSRQRPAPQLLSRAGPLSTSSCSNTHCSKTQTTRALPVAYSRGPRRQLLIRSKVVPMA